MRLTPGSPQPTPIGGNRNRNRSGASNDAGLLRMNLGNPPTFGLQDIPTNRPISNERADMLRERAMNVTPYSNMFQNNLPGYGSYMPAGAQQEMSGLASNLARQGGQRNLQALNMLLHDDAVRARQDRFRLGGQIGTSLASLNARLEAQRRQADLADDYVKNVLARLLA